MPDHHVLTELAEADRAPAGELYLVRGADLARWAAEVATLRCAVAAERAACRKVVEDRLRQMLVERRCDPVLLVRRMIADIDARGGGADNPR
jgi:hypothetical protein